MISSLELRSSLMGCLRLARFDAEGLRMMDLSPAGALRSFWLVLYLLPVIIFFDWQPLMRGLALAQAGDSQGQLFLVGWLVTYLFGWAVFVWFAILMMRLTAAPVLRKRALSAVLAIQNWMDGLHALLILVLILLASVIGGELAALLHVCLLLYRLVAQGFAYYKVFGDNYKIAGVLMIGNFALIIYMIQQNLELLSLVGMNA